MHNNFYFLRQISAKLDAKLKGFTLVSCFSQSKDELVFEFNDSKSSVFIRASLLPELSCISFPKKFQRARKNSVDLFTPVLMNEVTGVRQFSNERSFAVQLEGGFSVVFKMHGNRANVLMAENGVVTDIFKSNQENDLGMRLESLDKEIDWSKEAFVANVDRLDKLYFTFGKTVWVYLKLKGFDEGDTEKKWMLVRETLQKLENPTGYFIVEFRGTTYLSLVEFGNSDNGISNIEHRILNVEVDDPFEAVSEFASTYASRLSVARKTGDLAGRTRQEIKATTKYLQTSKQRLSEIQGDEHFKTWGDILMANLHKVGAGVKSVQLENFYNDNKPVDIPLDPTLSPQKNAERYYRKSKNRVIEIGKLNDAIQRHQAKLDAAEATLKSLIEPADQAALNLMLEKGEKQLRGSKEETLPFWQFNYKGFVIWAGRDAQNNDELTLKWAHKNDLWLHARDVAGSHVVLRHQANKPFPKDVIEYAASIAAWNSKRKNETLCPVIVTPRKFVRKKKGAAAGAVVIEREEVILVEPRNPAA